MFDNIYIYIYQPPPARGGIKHPAVSSASHWSHTSHNGKRQ